MPTEIADEHSLRDRPRVFADRTHAGDVLADLVEQGGRAFDLVLAIPAGGVPVAVELTRVLHLPLDVAVVSKIGVPSDPELGCGAVAWDGRTYVDDALVARLGMTDEELEAATSKAQERVARRLQRFGADGPEVSGCAVLLVDDGVASGVTLRLAVEAARAAGAQSVAVAVPTALRSSALALASQLDALFVANLRRGPRFTVAEAYRTWEDIAEDDALAQVEAVRRAAGSAGSGRTSRSPA